MTYTGVGKYCGGGPTKRHFNLTEPAPTALAYQDMRLVAHPSGKWHVSSHEKNLGLRRL